MASKYLLLFLSACIIVIIADETKQGDVSAIAKDYLHAANSFYAGKDPDQSRFFRHLSDAFAWCEGSKCFSTKQAFIERNSPAFGAVDNVFGHHQVIASSALPGGEPFVLAKLNTFAQQKKCNDWFQNMEIFVFNERNQIERIFAVFSDEKEYNRKQMAVNQPDCMYEAAGGDGESDTESARQTLEQLLQDIRSNNDGNFRNMANDVELIGNAVWNRFGVNDITNLEFKPYGIADDAISGYMLIYSKRGKCEIIWRDFVVLYMDEQHNIHRWIQLPVDSEPGSDSFEQCVKNAKHQEL